MPLTSAYDVKHTIYNQIITMRSENLQYFFMFNHIKEKQNSVLTCLLQLYGKTANGHSN